MYICPSCKRLPCPYQADMRKTPNISIVMAMISVEGLKIKNQHREEEKLAQTGSLKLTTFYIFEQSWHIFHAQLFVWGGFMRIQQIQFDIALRIAFPQVPIRKGLRAIYSWIGKPITLAMSIQDLYLNPDLRSLASEIITTSQKYELCSYSGLENQLHWYPQIGPSVNCCFPIQAFYQTHRHITQKYAPTKPMA